MRIRIYSVVENRNPVFIQGINCVLESVKIEIKLAKAYRLQVYKLTDRPKDLTEREFKIDNSYDTLSVYMEDGVIQFREMTYVEYCDERAEKLKANAQKEQA